MLDSPGASHLPPASSAGQVTRDKRRALSSHRSFLIFLSPPIHIFCQKFLLFNHPRCNSLLFFQLHHPHIFHLHQEVHDPFLPASASSNLHNRKALPLPIFQLCSSPKKTEQARDQDAFLRPRRFGRHLGFDPGSRGSCFPQRRLHSSVGHAQCLYCGRYQPQVVLARVV